MEYKHPQTYSLSTSVYVVWQEWNCMTVCTYLCILHKLWGMWGAYWGHSAGTYTFVCVQTVYYARLTIKGSMFLILIGDMFVWASKSKEISKFDGIIRAVECLFQPRCVFSSHAYVFQRPGASVCVYICVRVCVTLLDSLCLGWAVCLLYQECIVASGCICCPVNDY